MTFVLVFYIQCAKMKPFQLLLWAKFIKQNSQFNTLCKTINVKENLSELTKLYFRCCHKEERWVVLVVVGCGVVVRNIGQTFSAVTYLQFSVPRNKKNPVPSQYAHYLLFLVIHSSSYAETLKINFWDEYVVSALGIKLFLLELGERMKTPQKYINGPSKSTQAYCMCLSAQFL